MDEGLARIVNCQNCLCLLGSKSEIAFTYDPNKITAETHEINEDSCLMDLVCPSCGCITQIVVWKE